MNNTKDPLEQGRNCRERDELRIPRLLMVEQQKLNSELLDKQHTLNSELQEKQSELTKWTTITIAVASLLSALLGAVVGAYLSH
jgi:hypothetical protein